MATNSKGNNKTRSVSMSPELLAAAMDRADRLRLQNFSAYVRKLIEDDLAERGPLSFGESPTPEPKAQAKPVNYLKPLKRKAG
jgi:hypothetical protein